MTVNLDPLPSTLIQNRPLSTCLIFLVYTGFIYNDIFSKSINIFGPKWEVSKQPGLEAWLKSNSTPDDATITLNPNYTQTGMTHTDDSHMTYILGVYPYGMDPMWQLASNKIVFIDSFKMKASVILGVTQMCFGLVLSYMNHRYFGVSFWQNNDARW